MTDARLRVVIEALNTASKEIKDLGLDLKQLEKDSKTSKSGMDQLKDAWGKGKAEIAALGVGVAAAGAVIKQAFDLGREGAQVNQARESFQGLMREVGASPDLLKQLQAASRGTIDDLGLMASTTTLLAGTQGELATSLAGATPQLLEIAKAANKLNPSLGDTKFMYESLALGIKRGSPMIIDNLGITLKIGEANETYAKSLGKTVEQLTANEQKQALLNEVLRAGDTLIQQSGGSAESATDSFDRLAASVTNISNDLKAKLAPGLASAASAAELLLTWNDRLNTAAIENGQTIEDSAATYEEYKTRLEETAKAAGLVVDEEGNLVRVAVGAGGPRRELVQANFALTESTYNALRATEAYGESVDESAKLTKLAGILTQEESAKIQENAERTKEAEGAKRRLKDAQSLLAAALNGPLGEASQKYNLTLAETNTELAKAQAELDKYTKLNGQTIQVTDEAKFSQAELTLQAQKLAEAQAALAENTDPEKQAALTVAVEKASEKLGEMNGAMGGTRDVTMDYSTKIGEAQTKVDELTAKQQAAADQLNRTTLEFIYQKAAADLDAGAALELARSFGLVDEKSYEAAKKVSDLKTKYDANRDGAIDAAEAAAGYTDEVKKLGDTIAGIKDKTVTVNVNTRYTSSGNPSPAAGDIGLPGGSDGTYNPTPGENYESGGARASGGLGRQNRLYWTGENGPEPFLAPMDGRFLSNADAMQALAGSGGASTSFTIHNSFVIQDATNPYAVAEQIRFEMERMAERADAMSRRR